MERKKQIWWIEKAHHEPDHMTENFSTDVSTIEVSLSTNTCTSRSTAEKSVLSHADDSASTTTGTTAAGSLSEGPERCFDLISQAMTREQHCPTPVPSADDGKICDRIRSAPPMMESVKLTNFVISLDKVERPQGWVSRNSTTQQTKHKHSSQHQNKNRGSIVTQNLVSIDIEDIQENLTHVSPGLPGQYKHAVKLKHKSSRHAKTSESSCEDDFWLPEFRDEPKPIAKVAPKVVKTLTRCQWVSRKECVEKWQSKKDHFSVSVADMHSLVDITPLCSCPVCCYIQRATLLYENKDQLNDKFVITDQGTRFTIMEKSRPWHRTHITDCVNPKPLARRFPDIGTAHSSLACKVYSHKMVRPGMVIKDQKRIKSSDILSSDLFNRAQKKKTLQRLFVKGSSAISVI